MSVKRHGYFPLGCFAKKHHAAFGATEAGTNFKRASHYGALCIRDVELRLDGRHGQSPGIAGEILTLRF